jgi:hypothetical protein
LKPLKRCGGWPTLQTRVMQLPTDRNVRYVVAEIAWAAIVAFVIMFGFDAKLPMTLRHQ